MIKVIDAEGFRENVGIIISNPHGKVMWAKRFGQHSWQFPQGGIDQGETPEQAMYRELKEEVGLNAEQVNIVGSTKGWERYKLPKRLIRQGVNPVCIGQKQKWFLLSLNCSEDKVNVMDSTQPEFDDWRWVSYWYPVRNVVSFKREVYRRVMKEFVSLVMPVQSRTQKKYRHKSHRRAS